MFLVIAQGLHDHDEDGNGCGLQPEVALHVEVLTVESELNLVGPA